MEPLLVVEGLTKSFGGLKAVRAFNCRVNQRTVHALIGPNGAGKTTVFNLISGLLKPDAGRIRLEGRELTGLPAHMVSRAGIGRTFQTIRVFRDLTAEENVLVGLYAHSGVSVVRSALRPPVDRKLRREVEAALELVGLAPSAGTLARNLSYGEQKRLEMARALAWGPRVLLLDEPTAGMNPTEAAAIMQTIARIREAGRTVMLVEHNMRVVMDVSDWITVMDFGEVIAEGTPDRVTSDERVIKAYLGERKC
ncbi:MAG: ABC transporter ATP-binding protein [Bacillota bacterium]